MRKRIIIILATISVMLGLSAAPAFAADIVTYGKVDSSYCNVGKGISGGVYPGWCYIYLKDGSAKPVRTTVRGGAPIQRCGAWGVPENRTVASKNALAILTSTGVRLGVRWNPNLKSDGLVICTQQPVNGGI